MKKLVVIIVLIFVLCLAVIGAASADNVKDWSAAYTYDVPPGTFIPGFYPYRFEFDWTYPESGHVESYGTFWVDESAPLYPGYVVLRGQEFGTYARPWGEQGRTCIRLDEPVTIHPDQPLRFHIGWSTDYPMSPQDAELHFESMVTTVWWIDGGTHEMTGHEITPSGMGNRWPNNICSYTVRN